MKRDMELVRRILLAVEKHGEVDSDSPPEELRDVPSEVLGGHILIVIERGLVKGLTLGSHGTPAAAVATRLLWEGHDFLADARSDTVWQKTMGFVRERGGTASWDIFRAVLKARAAEIFGVEI